MPMESSWADALIGRLAVRYGEAFTRQWNGMDRAAVLADWAGVLDGVRPEAIRYALDNLPPDRPPNALQFRALCRRATADERQAPALPAPHPGKPSQEIRERLRQVRERLSAHQLRPVAAGKADQCSPD
jgi:hypothetical protein